MASVLKVDDIQSTSAGGVTFSTRPAFRAYLDTASGESNFTSLTVLNFDTVDFNVGSHFNLSNNEFTAPITGLYQINCSLIAGSATGVTTARLDVYVNDSAITGSATAKEDPQGGGKYTVNYSGVLSLSANDVLEFRHIHAGDTSVNIEYAEFSGFLVG